jgi:hypothetical protein
MSHFRLLLPRVAVPDTAPRVGIGCNSRILSWLENRVHGENLVPASMAEVRNGPHFACLLEQAQACDGIRLVDGAASRHSRLADSFWSN